MKQNYLQNGHKNPLITKAKRHWNHSYTLPTDQKFIFSNEKVYKSQKNWVQKPSVRSQRMTALAHNASRSKKNVVVPVFPFGDAWRAEWCSGAGPPRDRRVDKLLAVNVVIYVTMTSWWRRHLRHHVCAGRARHRPHYRLSRRQHSLPSPQVAYHTSRGSSGRPTGGGQRATQPMRPHEKPHDKNLVVSQTFQSLLLCYWLVYSHILRLFMSKFLYILYIIVYFCIYF